MLAGIDIPSAACWEVRALYYGAELAQVVLVGECIAREAYRVNPASLPFSFYIRNVVWHPPDTLYQQRPSP